MSRFVVPILASMAAACGPTIETSDGSASTDDTTTATSSSTAPSTRTTSGPGTLSTTRPDQTGEAESGVTPDLPGFDCDNPAHACSMPLDCEAWDCGAPDSQVDETGCLRRSCVTDDDCVGTDVCYRPLDWGQCASSGTSCHDGPDGVCECVSDPDCSGAWCIPGDGAPPAGGCDDTTMAACEMSGCESVLGRPIVPSNGGGCLCDLEAPQCIWMWDHTLLSPGNTAYMRYDDQSVVVFGWVASPPPLGWIACEDVAFPPPGCICAENLPCAMG
jgi:hypothetical protein